MRTRSVAAAGFTAMALALAACRDADLGTGMNTVTRHYSKPSEEVWKAAVKSAQGADLKIVADRHDAMGGELVARRATGGEVRVEVKSLSDKQTWVSARVGEGDVDLATMLQERIAQALGLGEAKTGLFGGNSLEVASGCDLTACLEAARCTFDSLDLVTVSEESHSTWSKIDGRLKDSTPVRIRMEKKAAGKTQIVLVAGNDKSDDNQAFAQKMKDQMERCLSKAEAEGR